MYNFRILYIEHDQERVVYKYTIEQSGDVVVDMLANMNEQELERLLNKNRYELVITDANFLPENQDHETGGAGKYELETIIKLVRKKDARTRIAVLTSFSPDLLKDHECDLEQVDYLWDKGSMPDEYLIWQVKAIIRDLNREYPEHTLLNKLDFLLKNELSTHPWHSQMDSMITKYRSRKNEKDKFVAISNSIAEIFVKYGLRTSFDPLMSSLIEMETLNVAGKPSTWGHLRHAINVYWLGSYMLNSGVIKKKNIVDTYGLNDENDVEFIWLLSSIFHDIGYLGEMGEDIIQRCNSLAANYPVGTIVFNPPNKQIPSTDLDNILPRLGRFVSDDLAPLYNEIKAPCYAFNHSVISALTVYNKFINKTSSDKLSDKLVTIACSAIAAHSFTRPKYKLDHNSKFIFAETPFVALLILCDIIQAWERDTGNESIKSKLPIETIELSDIEICTEKSSVLMCINYIPFKYILPEEIKMTEIKENLAENVFAFVIPALDSIIIDPAKDFTIIVKFVLDNRYDIAEWSSNKTTIQ